MSVTVTLNNVRFSYTNVFQPKPPFGNPTGEPKFSTNILIPKGTQAEALTNQSIEAAIAEGVTTKWGGVKPQSLAICVHDGDGPRPSDGTPYGPECKGCWVITATSKVTQPPFVVDAQVQPIIDPTQVYSGMWGNVSVSFFAYNNAGKRGIGCGLNGLQKVRDDEPLGNRVTAQDAFQAVGTAPAAAPAAPVYGTAPGYGYAAPMAPQINPFTGQPM